MKKWRALLFACALTLAMSGAALASYEGIAYLDIDTAEPAMQEAILGAGDTVLYQHSWVADGYEAYIQDVATGEVVQTLPTFSELFPGWQLPRAEVQEVDPDGDWPWVFEKPIMYFLK